MSVTIKMFDHVVLKDGREGAVVEIFGDQEAFEVDIGSSPEDWETITVKREDIVKVIPQ